MMRSSGVCTGSVVALLTGAVVLHPPAAGQTVRGQWDFDAGNLSATIGLPLEYFDPSSNGQTAAKTQFGTTASFGIAPIGGQVAAVMRFPKCLPDEGYVLRTNCPPNGGGSFINQYTLIFDILYPSASTGWRGFFQTNRDNANDGEFYANAANGIGISGAYHGNLTPDVWHRVAVAVDLTTATMAKYIDGTLVGTQTLGEGLDGRWSLYPASMQPDRVLLFTDDNNETNFGYVNSIQFRDYAMSAAEIAQLGGPTAEGIPTSAPALAEQWDFDGNLESSTGAAPLTAGAAAPAGIPGVNFTSMSIGGQSAQVAAFTRGTFFRLVHGLPANGGGSYVNQYTLLMDVMFPTTAPSGWAALWQTHDGNANDGDWFIRYVDHAIGISGNYGGYVPDGTWHRLALVLDAPAGTLTSYVNGQQVQQNTGLSVDGRWSIGPTALLFADENRENAAGYVNSVQIRGYAMSAAELAALGGPTAAGIPFPAPPGLQLTSPNGGQRWPAGSTQWVTWTASNPNGAVTIELYEGEIFRATIGTALMTDGQFAWSIPAALGDSTNYRVKIFAPAFPTVFDDSDGPFEVFGSVEPSPNITKQPMLQDYRPDAMTLLWETDSAAGQAAVEWGLFTPGESVTTDVRTEAVGGSLFVHTATMQPLQTETTYVYRVRNGATVSPTYSFRTAPRRATPFRVVWFADEQGHTVFRQHVAHMAARDPDLVLASGDLMPSGTSLTDWHNYWFNPLEIGHLAQTTPVLFNRGNHDGEGSLAYAYSALPGNEAWFAFTYGNVRFIFLDTNLPTSSHPQQLSWLQGELTSAEARSAQFRIVGFHKPPFTDVWDSTSYNGEAWVRNDWVPLFEQNGVDVVVNGHTHAYLRGDRGGVMYLIVGGAGGALDTVRSYDWGFFDVIKSEFHYNLVEFDRNRMRWTAYDLNDQPIDAFELISRNPLAPADFDGDGDVDVSDFGHFQACFNGSSRPPAATACGDADLDADGDVDVNDFAVFQACFNGPGRPPACAG